MGRKRADLTNRATPSFQFYPNDWLSSLKIACLTLEQEGAYIHLLCHDWANDGLPDDDEVLARLSRMGEQWFNNGSTAVRGCFQKHPTKNGFITNKRLEQEREKQTNYRRQNSKKGVKSGKARAYKVQPQLNHGSTNDEPKCNSSSSSSSSSSEFINISSCGKSLPTKREDIEFPVKWEKLKAYLRTKPQLMTFYEKHLWAHIVENFPRVKPPKSHKEHYPHLLELEKILRLDGISEQDLVRCFEWLWTSEDPNALFWRKQVHSVGNLRNKKPGDTMSKIQKIMDKFDAYWEAHGAEQMRIKEYYARTLS